MSVRKLILSISLASMLGCDATTKNDNCACPTPALEHDLAASHALSYYEPHYNFVLVNERPVLDFPLNTSEDSYYELVNHLKNQALPIGGTFSINEFVGKFDYRLKWPSEVRTMGASDPIETPPSPLELRYEVVSAPWSHGTKLIHLTVQANDEAFEGLALRLQFSSTFVASYRVLSVYTWQDNFIDPAENPLITKSLLPGEQASLLIEYKPALQNVATFLPMQIVNASVSYKNVTNHQEGLVEVEIIDRLETADVRSNDAKLSSAMAWWGLVIQGYMGWYSVIDNPSFEELFYESTKSHEEAEVLIDLYEAYKALVYQQGDGWCGVYDWEYACECD